MQTSKKKQYFVFAVLRNPMHMVASKYVKMKNNVEGNFKKTVYKKVV